MQNKKNNTLQGLRGISFLMIFLGHCGIGNIAGLGVAIFFAMSGFLMTINYYDRKIAYGLQANFKFALGKIKKLYPLHILMMLPMCGLYLLVAIKNHQLIQELLFLVPRFLLNAVLVQAWIPVRSFYFAINGVAWYLSVCTLLYFLFPWILNIIKQWRNTRQPIITFIMVLVLQAISLIFISSMSTIIPINLSWYSYICPLFRLGDFIIGCCFGYLFKQKQTVSEPSRCKATIIEIGSILFMVICYFIPSLLHIPEYFMLSFRFELAASVLVYVFAFSYGSISKLLKCKPFVFIGNLSAYTFLIHQVVINIVESLGISMPILLLVAFSVTMIGAILYRKSTRALSLRKGKNV